MQPNFINQKHVILVFFRQIQESIGNMTINLVPRVVMNNMRAECDVNNNAKILRTVIAFTTLKSAFKSETFEQGSK